MRPMLKPALVPDVADPQCPAAGAGQRRTRESSRASTTAAGWCSALLDGTRDLEQIHHGGPVRPEPDRSTVDTPPTTPCAAAPCVDDASLDAGPLRSTSGRPPARARLGPELSALSLLHPAPGDALPPRLGRRRGQARLAVAGPAVLVETASSSCSSRQAPRQVDGLCRRWLEPGRRTRWGGARPDFLVLATVGLLDLHRVRGARQPHHPASRGLRTRADRHRRAAGRARRPRPACTARSCSARTATLVGPASSLQFRQVTDVASAAPAALAAMVAATASAAGDEPSRRRLRPPRIEGSLEVTLPDWKLRRRSWRRHPECPCALSAAG